MSKTKEFYCSEFCVMDAYGYQAGAELDTNGPELQSFCHYCGGQILALSPAYYASGLGESLETFVISQRMLLEIEFTGGSERRPSYLATIKILEDDQDLEDVFTGYGDTIAESVAEAIEQLLEDQPTN